MTKVIHSIDINTLTPYESFQLEKYGNILPEVNDLAYLENGSLESERFREWNDAKHNQQLLQFEENF